jgi:hypothetical protein
MEACGKEIDTGFRAWAMFTEGGSICRWVTDVEKFVGAGEGCRYQGAMSDVAA